MKNYPMTQAVRVLKTGKIHFIPHLYPYEEHGGTHQAASVLDVPEYEVIKTLVMEVDSRRQLLVLMHGDREVSTKQLARELGVKRVSPCDPIAAEKHTGYKVGGISLLGTRKSLQVIVESSIMILDKIFINAGKRGFMVEIDPCDLEKVFPVQKVNVAVGGSSFLTGCCPNHFSLALKHFLINLRLVPGDSKTRPSGSSSWNRFSFTSQRFMNKKRFNERSKRVSFGQQSVK